MRHIIATLAVLIGFLAIGQRSSVEKEHQKAFGGLTSGTIERKNIDPAEVEHLAIHEFADSIFTGRELEHYQNLVSLYLVGRPIQIRKRDRIQPPMRLKLAPAALQNMRKLRHLVISYFDLHDFPEELFQLAQLRGLTLMQCNMDSLPAKISTLSELEVLDLSFNYLTNLPVSIAKLKSLEVLTLSHNHFRTIPSVVVDIQGLRRVDLDNPYSGDWNMWSRAWPYPVCNNHVDWESDTTTLGILLRSSSLESIKLPRDECGDPIYFNQAFTSRPWSKKVRWDMKPQPCPDIWPDRAFKRFPVPCKDQIDRGKCSCGLKGYSTGYPRIVDNSTDRNDSRPGNFVALPQ